MVKDAGVDGVTISEESVAPERTADRPLFRRLLATLLRPSARQGLVVLFDQGGYSLATFLTGILVARVCPKAEYGTFVLGLTLVFFSGVVQRGLVAIPFSVLSQPLDRQQRSVYLGSSLVQHIALSGLIATGFAIIWVIARSLGHTTGIVTLLIPLAAMAVAVHFRVFMRSVLLAQLRPWASFAMGLATNVITLSGVVGLYSWGRLTVPAACLAMAVGSAAPAGAALLTERAKLSLKQARVRHDFTRNWRYGRWILASTGANVAGIRVLPWLTLFWCGKEIVAIVGVVTMVACIVRPALEASFGYLTPKLADYTQLHGIVATKAKVSILIRPAIAAGFIYVLLMLFFGDQLVGIFYTSRYQGHAVALAMIAAAISVKAVEVPVRAFLMATKRTKTLCHSSICASIVTLLTAFAVIPRFGIVGVASAILTHRTVSLVINYLGMILWSGRPAKAEYPETSDNKPPGTLFKRTYVPSGAGELIHNAASIVKKVDPMHVKTEFAVTQAAHNMAKYSGLFYVPSVIGEELDSGTIELERIDGLVTLRDRFVAGADDMDLLKRVGKALAYTHENLELPEYLKSKVTLDWECEDSDLVCFHGDFNIYNVCCQQEHDRLVVLDWASAGVVSRGKTVGSRHFDLGKFLRSLLCQQLFLLDSIGNFNKRARAFLEGYQQQLGRKLDCRLLRRYLLKMVAHRIRIQLERRRLKRAAGNSIAYLFLWALSARWPASNAKVRPNPLQNVPESQVGL